MNTTEFWSAMWFHTLIPSTKAHREDTPECICVSLRPKKCIEIQAVPINGRESTFKSTENRQLPLSVIAHGATAAPPCMASAACCCSAL